jgi:DNA (cytosine-5)-methyltransferase 1
MLRVLDLFSGIGGFSLGLERTGGFKTVAFCEIEEYPRRVLAKHWPDVPCYKDIRELSAQHLFADGISVDVICGGFPCQDISIAGKGAGLAGERSGLWSHYARLIGELRPRYVLVENVAALLGRGLGDVLGDLAALGYDAEWHCIPASAVGAPHRRDRVWIVAYAKRCETSERFDAAMLGGRTSEAEQIGLGSCLTDVADADSRGWREQGDVGQAAGDARRAGQSGDGGALVNADDEGCGKPEKSNARRWFDGEGKPDDRTACGAGDEIRIPSRPRLEIGPGTLGEWSHAATTGTGWWTVEPNVGRVVNELSGKVDRRKRLIGLGNAVVPMIPELLGRAILRADVS